MAHFKLLLWFTLVITLYGLTHGVEDAQENTNNEEIFKPINKSLEDERDNLTNTRTGRVLVHPPRAPAFTLRRRQPIKIRSRSDHYPLRTQIRRVYNGVANVQPQSLRYGYESLKSSKYMPSSKGGSTQFFNHGKGGGSAYRQQLLGGHPNSVHVPALSQQYIHNFKASPAYNGNVVVHPASQQQQQDSSYPKYVIPQQQPAAATKPQYPDLKQFPIPDQDQMQKYNEQHEKYLQQQKYLTPRDPLAYYQQQQQKHQVQQPQYIAQKPIIPQPQLQQPSIPIHEISSDTAGVATHNNIAFPSTARPQTMYSVYEENDMTELQNNNYQTASYQGLDKEAKEYLRFMNTNEYFLPKIDPNYKLIDEENDRRQYNNLNAQQQQSSLQPYAQSLYQQQEQQQQPQTPYQQSQTHPQPTPYQQPQSQSQPQKLQQRTEQQQKLFPPQQPQLYLNNRYSDTSAASSYSQPIQVSKLFYDYNQDDGKPSNPASSTLVKTSYHTGHNQNQFLVNSQNNKVFKYNSAPSPSATVVSTPTTIQTNNIYSQVRQNSPSSRTPEPLRFEFTEHDAMVGGVSYTYAPQGQLRYKAVASNATPKLPTVESSTTSSMGATLSTSLSAQTYNHNRAVKPVVELDDDPEDGDDIQEVGTNLYGRQAVVNKNAISKKQTSTTVTPPSEQKDTEEYCERICAIVEDEHEEIICGSDGFMYTSEAQMECYASCLHIDVTIQGKGSCSAR